MTANLQRYALIISFTVGTVLLSIFCAMSLTTLNIDDAVMLTMMMTMQFAKC